MNTLRAVGLLTALTLLSLSSACGDDDSQPTAPSNAGGEPASSVGGAAPSASAGAPDAPGPSAGGEPSSAGGNGGDSEPGGGAGSGTEPGGAPSTGDAGNDVGGSGPAPGPNICEQAIAHLTSCEQLQGAGEAGENCSPDNLASQCVVPCLLVKSCEELVDWPAPILDCVAVCTP